MQRSVIINSNQIDLGSQTFQTGNEYSFIVNPIANGSSAQSFANSGTTYTVSDYSCHAYAIATAFTSIGYDSYLSRGIGRSTVNDGTGKTVCGSVAEGGGGSGDPPPSGGGTGMYICYIYTWYDPDTLIIYLENEVCQYVYAQ